MKQQSERRALIWNMLAFGPANIFTLLFVWTLFEAGYNVLSGVIITLITCVILFVITECYYKQQCIVHSDADWGLSRRSAIEHFIGGIAVGSALALTFSYLL